MNKKTKISIFLNTTEFGGAERSLVHQFKHLSENNQFDITFFIPGTLDSKITKATQQITSKQHSYQMPHSFYQYSRESGLKGKLLLLLGIIQIVTGAVFHKNLFSDDVQYANGNKAALFLLLIRKILSIKKPFYWHWRDYPTNNYFLNQMILWLIKDKNVFLIANSDSVKLSLASLYGKEALVIYNLVGEKLDKREVNRIKTIGIVGMLAPWKGLHSMILFSKVYEDKLKELGIEKIAFYGASIYKTKGEHENYGTNLLELVEKLKPQLVELKGLEDPVKIFNQIDLLIHPSLKPEPFGRVLIEGMEVQIPVLSTGLGGAKEVLGNKDAFFAPYDYESLFQKIKKLTEPDYLKNFIIYQNGQYGKVNQKALQGLQALALELSRT